MGHNDDKTREHWKQELRNVMYQLSDDELIDVLSRYKAEQERVRVALRIAEDIDEKEDEENCHFKFGY
jgi:hypothetical protein